MESASTAMQATISCDMTCPWEFHTSHRLGPNMSITCKTATAARSRGASGSLSLRLAAGRHAHCGGPHTAKSVAGCDGQHPIGLQPAEGDTDSSELKLHALPAAQRDKPAQMHS